MNQIIFRAGVTQLCKPGVGSYNPSPEMSVLVLTGPFAAGSLRDTEILTLRDAKTQHTKSRWLFI